MKAALPKIILGFLLLIMALPMLMPALYEMQKWEIKKEMLGLLKERKLHTVRIPASDVVWMDDHEIWVNEHMFDIASSELADGIYTFTGLYDEEETRLVKMQMQTGEEESDDKQRIRQIVKFLNSPCIINDTELPYTRLSSKIIYPLVFSRIAPVFTAVTTPPPKRGSYHTT